jgi:outer membrane receptor protein involved in Fe transport
MLGLGFSLDLAAMHTFLQATFVNGSLDGQVLPYSPSHTVSTILDFDHPVGVGAEVAFTYMSAQFTDDRRTVIPDESGRVGLIDGYPTLDAIVRYRHTRSGLSTNIAMKNLLGVINIASRRPDGIFPTRMRQILLGVRWDYR